MTEVLYSALVLLLLGVGIAIVIGGLVGGLVPVVAVGGLFLVIGLQEGRSLLFRTASEIAFDSVSGELSWRSTLGRGCLQVTDLEAVKRSSRPGIYSLVANDRSQIDFWLDTRNRELQDLFSAVQTANPLMSTEELYRRGRLWWRGLPSPQ